MKADRYRARWGYVSSLSLILGVTLTTASCASDGTPADFRELAQVSVSADVPVRQADQTHDIAPPPVQLSYPEIAADIPVSPSGVAEDGQMEIPDDAAHAGWYQYGKAPAEQSGHTVIAAHAGSAQTPVGPLYALTEAQSGDEIVLTDQAGHDHRYSVTEIEQLRKEGLDFTEYFQRSGPHRLVLITCGGQWIPELNSYAENVIVIAEPTG